MRGAGDEGSRTERPSPKIGWKKLSKAPHSIWVQSTPPDHSEKGAPMSKTEETRNPATATFKARAYAATSPTSGLGPFSIPRRQPGPKDVQIEILYCGICHTD